MRFHNKPYTDQNGVRWKPVPQHTRYSVSEDGEVINELNVRIIKSYANREGKYQVRLVDDFTGSKTDWYVHRLVAELFMRDFDPEKRVQHISDDYRDNSIQNLTQRGGYASPRKNR